LRRRVLCSFWGLISESSAFVMMGSTLFTSSSVVPTALLTRVFPCGKCVGVRVNVKSAAVEIGFADVEVLECDWVEFLMLTVEKTCHVFGVVRRLAKANGGIRSRRSLLGFFRRDPKKLE
jgi:hypothetical protein